LEKEVSELESLSKFPTSIRQQLLGELEEGPFWEVPVGPGTFLRDPEYTDPEDRPWPGVEEEIIKLFREKEKRNFVEALWIMGIGFGKNFGALALSAPNYEDDFIERKATEEGVYVSRNPTWANRRPNFYSGKMFSFDTEKMEIIR